MKNTLLSLSVVIPLFILLQSPESSSAPEPTVAAVESTTPPPCSPQTTGGWTLSYSQINPFPCGDVTITATYNNGSCPAAGDITITKSAASGVTMTPNPLVGSIPGGVNSFVVGVVNFSHYAAGQQMVKLEATVTGGHTITNPIYKGPADTCL